MPTSPHNSPRDWFPFLLVILALAIYLPAFTWGIPAGTGADRVHAWGNDDLVPLEPLAEMSNTFVKASPDRNVAYPWFQYFLAACAEGPYMAKLYLTGGLKNPQPVYPFGLADPAGAFRILTLLGRSVTLLLALTTVVGAYFTAKFLWNSQVGLLAGVFTLLMYPMAYYARVGNPDVPVLGWTSLGLAAFALALRQGLTVRRGAWFGAFVALAVATKDQAAASFVLLPFVLLWMHLRAGKSDALGRWVSRWAAPVATTGSFALVYVWASGIPVDPRRFIEHVGKVVHVTEGALYLRYPATLAGYAAQTRDLLGYLVDVMSWPVILAALVGLVIAVRKDRLALTLVLPSVCFFTLLIPVRMSRMHYLMPVALPLICIAAYAFSEGLRGSRPVRWVSRVLALGTCAFLLALTVDLTHDMIHDSRYAAGAWLDQHVRPGDRILYWGASLRNPPMRTDMQTIHIEYRQQSLPTIQEARPEYLLVFTDDTNEDRHRVEWRYGPHSLYSDYLPSEVYARMIDGTLGYRLVAQFQTPRLFPWLNRPFLTYPTVNIPIQIFAREDRAAGAPKIDPWQTAPHYPNFVRVRELTIDSLGEKR
jgi:hypothetical protein